MKPLLTKLIFLPFLLLTCLSLSTCQRANAPSEDGISYTDALGRDIVLPKNPKRVAALLGSFADVFVLAGGELCAAPVDAWEDFALELPSAVNIGGAHSPSLELLIASSPDLVIASASTASNVALQEPLETMGIPVVYFDVDGFADYLEMLRVCTDITGRSDLYEKNGLAIKAQIDSIKASYLEEDLSESERRVLLLRASSTGIKTKGSQGTILGEMLAQMGCINVADRDGTMLDTLSMEAIVRENPHHIFIVTMGSDTNAALNYVQRSLLEDPVFSHLDAVLEGRFHLMDKSLFNLKPNAKWGIAYAELYDKLTKE